MNLSLFQRWVYGGGALVLMGFLFDFLTQIEPCSLCLIQRIILGFSVVMMFLQAEIMVLSAYVLGILLVMRHLYIIIFAPKAIGCLPISMLNGLPYAVYPQFILNWLSQLGTQCGVAHPKLDLMFLGLLLAYYVIGMLLSKRVKIGSIFNERIHSS
jgi:disulfide bond formation protein DsbB